jgi:SAM-dependent methyltransferase
MMQKLNLGCGEFKKQGYVNVDINPRVNPDVLLDLNNPKSYSRFADSSFDEIFCEHVLEHLDRPFKVMEELHRILKPGGRLIIRVPHFSRGFTHAEHAHGFDAGFPEYFNPSFKGGYMGFPLILRKMRLRWIIRFDLKKTVIPSFAMLPLRAMNAVFNFLANLNPYICSRFWCFYVGGFEEIEYLFTKPQIK